LSFYPTFFELTQSFQTSNEDILQSVIYAYGTITSRFTPEDFTKYQALILTSINHLLSRPVNDSNGLTYDNAVASFGKVILNHMLNSPDVNSLVTQYLNLLPLKHDMEESEKVTLNLLNLLNQGHSVLTQDSMLSIVKETIKRINSFRTEEGEFLEHEGVALMLIVSNKFQIN